MKHTDAVWLGNHPDAQEPIERLWDAAFAEIAGEIAAEKEISVAEAEIIAGARNGIAVVMTRYCEMYHQEGSENDHFDRMFEIIFEER